MAPEQVTVLACSADGRFTRTLPVSSATAQAIVALDPQPVYLAPGTRLALTFFPEEPPFRFSVAGTVLDLWTGEPTEPGAPSCGYSIALEPPVADLGSRLRARAAARGQVKPRQTQTKLQVIAGRPEVGKPQPRGPTERGVAPEAKNVPAAPRKPPQATPAPAAHATKVDEPRLLIRAEVKGNVLEVELRVTAAAGTGAPVTVAVPLPGLPAPPLPGPSVSGTRPPTGQPVVTTYGGVPSIPVITSDAEDVGIDIDLSRFSSVPPPMATAGGREPLRRTTRAHPPSGAFPVVGAPPVTFLEPETDDWA